MIQRCTLLGLCALIGSVALAQDDQDPAPPIPPPIPSETGASEVDPWAELQPGVLPAGRSAAATAAFGQLLAGTAPSAPAAGAETGPPAIRSFWMDFRIITRLESVNQIEAHCEFLRPAHCRFATGSDNSTSWRGPEGYWIQSEDARAERLVGEQFAPDREFLDELVAVSNNMLALFEPRELRVVELTTLEGPPALAPQPYQEGERRPREAPEPSELDWIAITTPDCVVLETSRARGTTSARSSGRLYRLTLGMDAATGRPLLARIEELIDGRPDLRNAVFVALRQYLPMRSGTSGWTRTIPFQLDIFAIDPEQRELRFEKRPRWELGVTGGELDPVHLTEASFGAP